MILNIQEMHDLAFWGGGGVWFSVSPECLQTDIRQDGEHAEENKGYLSLP